MMGEFTLAILLAAPLGVAAQDSTLEDKAVFRVQQTPASRYDPTLPNQPFGRWLGQVVGPQSGLNWRLGECVEQDGKVSEWEQSVPICVEATAVLPDDRKVITQILVGYFRQGLSMTPRFHFAAVEKDNRFQNARRLSDLPQLLRAPVPAKGLNGVILPQISSTGALRFYGAETPMIFRPPKMTMVETVAEPPPPPPKPAGGFKESKGVTAGAALVKVTPIYPPMAKRVKASGEVQVAITINENGRVIEAKAISGHPALRSAAEEAARKWIFRPTRSDGQPMRQEEVLTFIFSLPQ